MARSALLIVNAKSRSGRDALEAIVQAAQRHGLDPVHAAADDRESLSRLIAERGSRHDLVMVAGGDGTLNAAAQGVLDAKRPLGVIPTGTANDLARTLGIPADIDQAVAIVAAGGTRQIDLGLVNDKPFFNVASIGLSVELTHELTADMKKRFGKLGYPLAAMRVLARAKPFRARIVHENGRVRSLTFQIAVGNGCFYGGGNRVDENAEIDDGVMDLYSLEFVRAWRLALALKALRFGQHGSWKEIRSMRGQSFEIRTHRPRPVNADGEIITETPATFRILPRAMEVFAPSAN